MATFFTVAVIKLQALFRGNKSRHNLNFNSKLIGLLNKNNVIMSHCYIKILKILKKYPPAKNENKFIYGKLIENTLINAFNQIIKCQDLDVLHTVGSEYKYDCRFRFLMKAFSIKASKSGGTVTIINKRNRAEHDISQISFILCHIKNKSLYIFNHDDTEDFERYVKYDGAAIHYKSGIFTYLKKHNQFIYKFPENDIITEFIDNKLPYIEVEDIYTRLYNEL